MAVNTVVQPCARCGARWAVQGRPMHWCPRCHGVLLSPAPVDAPPQRRNYRWVARPPGRRRPRDTHPSSAKAPLPTPRYTDVPRWGLHDVPRPPVAAPRTRLDRLTDRLLRLLTMTAALFALSAAAEFGRYLLLMWNRTRLIEPIVVYLSDWSVRLFAVLALIFALLTAIALVGWLIQARRRAYAAAGQRDPRGMWSLLLGCVIPVVNLVWPGVFLTELARRDEDPRVSQAVRIWWAVWVINGVMSVAALGFRATDTLQAQANGVIFTVYTDLVATGVAVLSLWLVRMFEGVDLRGRRRLPRRWLATGGPAVPVIEPVHPAAAEAVGAGVADSAAAVDVPSGPAAERAADPEVVQDVRAESVSGAESEQEEVMAK
ncbi:DUF4328 domain-containing protein [Nocardia macrotermitis]|uniref:DUF4328 domain-containing protein n=1 Tax=Nocardia macrotermitis TaxID=2585198 RepID=A0A7K0D9W2_9NOCA|nr:DUF4328 domain-containing protein [Nocardia macrotermitis]MQY22351.1 hypothetical protein [Nocardia macrotermitis]